MPPDPHHTARVLHATRHHQLAPEPTRWAALHLAVAYVAGLWDAIRPHR